MAKTVREHDILREHDKEIVRLQEGMSGLRDQHKEQYEVLSSSLGGRMDKIELQMGGLNEKLTILVADKHTRKGERRVAMFGMSIFSGGFGAGMLEIWHRMHP